MRGAVELELMASLSRLQQRNRTKILIESSDTAVGFSTCLLAAVQPYSRTAVQLYKFSFLFFMHARCRSVAVFLPELSTAAQF